MENYSFNPNAVPTFLAAAAFLFISLYRVIREKFSYLSNLLFLVGLIVSFWLFSFSWMYCANNDGVALRWAKIAYFGIPFLPTAIYNFSLVFLQVFQQNRNSVRVCWAISMFFSLLAVQTDLIISGVKRYQWGYYPQYDVFSIPYLMFFFGVLSLCLYHYVTEYRKTLKGTAHHQRLKLFIIAFSIASLAIVDYFAKFGINVYPFGYLPFLVFLLLSSLTISRYKMVDITPAFTAEKIIDTMNDILFVTDPEGIIRLVNKAALKFTGKFGDDLIGKHITQVISNDYFSNQFENLLASEPITNFEITCCSRKDSNCTLSLSIAAIKDKTNQSLAVVIVAKDITYLKRAEKGFHKREDDQHMGQESSL
jgi:PAS domain S-box-containing protein